MSFLQSPKSNSQRKGQVPFRFLVLLLSILCFQFLHVFDLSFQMECSLLALTQSAVEFRLTRPQLTHKNILQITGGRYGHAAPLARY